MINELNKKFLKKSYIIYLQLLVLKFILIKSIIFFRKFVLLKAT